MNAFASIVDQVIKQMFCRQKPTRDELLCESISRQVERYRNTLHPCGARTTAVPPNRNTNGKAGKTQA